MNTRHLLLFSLASTLALGACQRAPVTLEVKQAVAEPLALTKTFETANLGRAIDDFERAPSPTNSASVKKAFAEIDGEIAELQELAAKRSGSSREEAFLKQANLESYRNAEAVRFAKVQAATMIGLDPAVDGRTGAEKIEDSAKELGHAIEHLGKKTGEAIKDVAR